MCFVRASMHVHWRSVCPEGDVVRDVSCYSVQVANSCTSFLILQFGGEKKGFLSEGVSVSVFPHLLVQ